MHAWQLMLSPIISRGIPLTACLHLPILSGSFRLVSAPFVVGCFSFSAACLQDVARHTLHEPTAVPYISELSRKSHGVLF